MGAVEGAPVGPVTLVNSVLSVHEIIHPIEAATQVFFHLNYLCVKAYLPKELICRYTANFGILNI